MTKLTILTAILSLFVAISSQAEVTSKRDEFKGTTTVFIRPHSSWTGNTPTLFMDTQVSDRKNKPYYVFGVVFKTSFTDTCASGVTGVIADGERVKTMTEQNPSVGYSTGKYKVVKYSQGGVFGRQPEYLVLMEKYYPAEFEKIVNAQSVKYQLCGKDEWVYELTAQEINDLKEYATIVMPEQTKPYRSPLDMADDILNNNNNNSNVDKKRRW